MPLFRQTDSRVTGLWLTIAVLAGLVIGLWVRPMGSHCGAREISARAEAAPVMTPASLAALGDAFARIAERVTPAVVNINTTRIIRRPGLFQGPFFQYFFGDTGPWQRRQEERQPQSLGSGVLISPSGYIVTNNHVIEGADEITVVVPRKGEYPGRLVGADPATDVAVVRIQATNLPYVAWGDSDKLRVGEWVVAVGSPFGLNQTVTAGIVSAKGRTDVGISGYEDFIQTDAAINPGNSGGALVNITGELVGINTAIFSQSGGYEGIGFAIPARLADRISTQLIKEGRVIRAFLGVFVKTVTARLAPRLGLTRPQGVVVYNLYRHSPAEAAGLLPYDVIVRFNGAKINTPGDLRRAVSDAPLDAPASLLIFRAGKLRTLTIKPMKQPRDRRTGRPLPGI